MYRLAKMGRPRSAKEVAMLSCTKFYADGIGRDVQLRIRRKSKESKEMRRNRATIPLAKFLSTLPRVGTGWNGLERVRAGCRAADRVWSEKRPSIFLDIVVFQFLANDTQKSELLFRSGRFSFSFSNWRILSKRVSLQLTRLGHHFVE